MLRLSALMATVFVLFSFRVEAQSSGDRFKIDSGCVYDRSNNLTWMRCSVGQKWDQQKNTCVGKPSRFKFSQAQKLAKNGWRVPSKSELLSIVVPSQGNESLHLDQHLFYGTKKYDAFYWTSEINAEDDAAWFVDFSNGNADYILGDYDVKEQKLLVRLVATGQIRFKKHRANRH